jgi:hypothetical protein
MSLASPFSPPPPRAAFAASGVVTMVGDWTVVEDRPDREPAAGAATGTGQGYSVTLWGEDSCPTGFDTAYTGVMVWSTILNNPAEMVCLGTKSESVAGEATGFLVYQKTPLPNPRQFKCAVCVK